MRKRLLLAAVAYKSGRLSLVIGQLLYPNNVVDSEEGIWLLFSNMYR
jgi:hypothetical protein